MCSKWATVVVAPFSARVFDRCTGPHLGDHPNNDPAGQPQSPGAGHPRSGHCKLQREPHTPAASGPPAGDGRRRSSAGYCPKRHSNTRRKPSSGLSEAGRAGHKLIFRNGIPKKVRPIHCCPGFTGERIGLGRTINTAKHTLSSGISCAETPEDTVRKSTRDNKSILSVIPRRVSMAIL